MKSFANGRFVVEKKLGQGQQGLVYLVNDTQQQRRVALKVLHSHAIDQLQSAQILSQFNHPSMVSLYEILLDQGHPCVVFELLEGQTMVDHLQATGPVSPVVAVQWLQCLLESVTAAAQLGVTVQGSVLHNVFLTTNGQVKLMDFAISPGVLNGDAALLSEAIGRRVDRQSAVVFAYGLMLYQMLSGQYLTQDAQPELLTAIASGTLSSTHNAAIDPQLNHLLMVALCEGETPTYADIGALQTALSTWLLSSEGQQSHAAQRNSTFEFLLRRMRHTADFPSLSQTISAINKLNDVEGERLQNLSSVILQDFSLTNKLLKMVNSANYGHFGGSISTISRAIVILGFDTVRNLAITILLFEHMQNKGQAERLREAVLQSFFGGILARELGVKSAWRDVEELLICGVFQHLGRLLTLYYFHEESLEINKREQQNQESESVAAEAVLGISYRELAAAVMQTWHFPERITQSLRELPSVRYAPQNQAERLRVFANLSFDLLPLVSLSGKASSVHLQQVVQRYAGAVSWKEAAYHEVLRCAAQQYLDYLSILGVDIQGSVFARSIKKIIAHSDIPVDGAEVDGMQAAAIRLQEQAPALNAAASLAAGVQDITNTMVGEFKLNDVLRMILETMYRSVGFERVLFCTRDSKSAEMVARFGFGADIEQILPQFKFKLEPVLDVFQWVLAQQADVLVEDINAKNITDRIPAWYRALLPAQTLIVFPLVLDKKTIGLFYGDKRLAQSLVIAPEQLNLLKTLRNQAILAIKQKQLSG
ncbi:HDOD domain-containing protein [Deefgea piscis]|uniref:HDOD domain-containing protein n=1 Tax=Deefgea piscis TaxID=2739061 RepID=UPI001C7E5237|nr:HDOD domain-containing protein [Deefgea piscis]QZA79840.1 HDOD domain-containing protein [Deefgea piscis]